MHHESAKARGGPEADTVDDDGDKPGGRGNRERRQLLAKLNSLCQYCPPHKGCNQYTVRRPKCDRRKNHRRG